jgi:hypothetical protein
MHLKKEVGRGLAVMEGFSTLTCDFEPRTYLIKYIVFSIICLIFTSPIPITDDAPLA